MRSYNLIWCFSILWLIYWIPAALSSLFFYNNANRLASSISFPLALRFAFFPLVLARRTLASASISFSSSSISIGSGRAAFVSGLGSISPGLNLLGSLGSFKSLPYAYISVNFLKVPNLITFHIIPHIALVYDQLLEQLYAINLEIF